VSKVVTTSRTLYCTRNQGVPHGRHALLMAEYEQKEWWQND